MFGINNAVELTSTGCKLCPTIHGIIFLNEVEPGWSNLPCQSETLVTWQDKAKLDTIGGWIAIQYKLLATIVSCFHHFIILYKTKDFCLSRKLVKRWKPLVRTSR